MIEDALRHQPAAAAAVAAALAAPSHAYLLTGPPGSGKREAARAFAAELLAASSPDPDSTRSRAMQDPSPHPDLEWLEPVGTRHRVEDLRERVVARVSHRPYEGDRRIFVIAAAEAVAPEGQNALLKTLEEPAETVTLILVADELATILPTVRSRCQEIGFVAPPAAAVAAELARDSGVGDAKQVEAAVKLAGGDVRRARFLLSDSGRELRAMSEATARATVADRLGDLPWSGILELAEQVGETAGDEMVERVRMLGEQFGDADTRDGKRRVKDAADDSKRVARRERTATLDLALGIICAWWRDLAVHGEGVGDGEGGGVDGTDDLLLNVDRAAEVAADAANTDPIGARRAAELAMQTRSRLRLNVNEELAFEALHYRAAYLLGSRRRGRG